MIFIMPAVTPSHRSGELSVANRRRLALALEGARSISDAACRYGCSSQKLVQLAKREGFHQLLEPLRSPLTFAMRDPTQREELVKMIHDGVKAELIGRRFHSSKSAVWSYFYRTGLDATYLQARKSRGRRRMLEVPAGNDPELVETFCLAALLASRGLPVGAIPTYKSGLITGCSLEANGWPVRVVHANPQFSERTYHRCTPSVGNALYLFITPRRFVVGFAPPHDGRTRYIPIDHPGRIMESRNRPAFFWSSTEWPTAKQLGFKARRQAKTKVAA